MQMPTEVNPEGDHNSESDSQLLESDQATSYFRGCNLGIVQRDRHTERTNPETSDETT
jgi:hypothetical protein